MRVRVLAGVGAEASFDEVLDVLDLTGDEPEVLFAAFDSPSMEIVFQVEAHSQRRAKRLVEKTVKPALWSAGIRSAVEMEAELTEEEEEERKAPRSWMPPTRIGGLVTAVVMLSCAGCAPTVPGIM